MLHQFDVCLLSHGAASTRIHSIVKYWVAILQLPTDTVEVHIIM